MGHVRGRAVVADGQIVVNGSGVMGRKEYGNTGSEYCFDFGMRIDSVEGRRRNFVLEGQGMLSGLFFFEIV